MSAHENIAVFAYSWTNPPYSKLDNYLDQFILSFKNFGYNIDIYIANQFVESDGIFGLSKNINFEKLNDVIRTKKYKLILSINNSLLTKRLNSLKEQPVVDLIVDDFNHLFNHDRTGLYDQFIYADKVIFSSYSHKKKLESNNKNVVGRTHFFPTATSVSNVLLDRPLLTKKYHISWVASLLDTSAFTLLYHRCIDFPEKIGLLRLAVSITKDGGEIPYNKFFGQECLDAILKEHKWNRVFFEMQVQNLISNETRVSVGKRLSHLGLTIFGNHEWVAAAGYNSDIFDSFRSGKSISSHNSIMEIYNSSKICINVPQAQTGSALPYRVVDILASDALLITSYHPDSDAFAIFGKECPIVMYRNLDELHDLCEYYLSHENERIKLVRQCNELVRNGFDFKDRCRDILRVAGLSAPQENSKPGDVHYINADNFVFTSKKLKVRLKSIFIIMIKKLFSIIPLNIRRSLIINLR